MKCMEQYHCSLNKVVLKSNSIYSGSIKGHYNIEMQEDVQVSPQLKPKCTCVKQTVLWIGMETWPQLGPANDGVIYIYLYLSIVVL